jgi:hypothetical protein
MIIGFRRSREGYDEGHFCAIFFMTLSSDFLPEKKVLSSSMPIFSSLEDGLKGVFAMKRGSGWSTRLAG